MIDYKWELEKMQIGNTVHINDAITVCMKIEKHFLQELIKANTEIVDLHKKLGTEITNQINKLNH